MKYEANNVDDYISQLPEERQIAIQKIREIIKNNIPEGFEEGINYNMIGFYVPHSIYPKGYHCNTDLPLPFINLASQKNSINLYHTGIYAKKELLNWFTGEYPKHNKRKLDMGKSCIRFKNIDEITYQLIGELVKKMSVKEWIDIYEKSIKNKD